MCQMLPTCFPQGGFISSHKHKVRGRVSVNICGCFSPESGMCISICPLLFFSDGYCVKRHLQVWAFSLVCDPAGECFPRILSTSKADAQQHGMGDIPSYTSITEQGMWNWLFLAEEPASDGREAILQAAWEDCERMLLSQRGRRMP